jgi:hypothetical protein
VERLLDVALLREEVESRALVVALALHNDPGLAAVRVALGQRRQKTWYIRRQLLTAADRVLV